MAEVKKPTVFWGQNKSQISLKVDLQNIIDGPNVEITEDKVTFSATTRSPNNGINKYEFEIVFYLPIDPENSTWQAKPLNVLFDLRKVGEETWQRLTFEQKKLFWLKIDFDKVHYSDSEDEKKPSFEDLRKLDDLLKDNKEADKSSKIKFRIVYLFLFSMFQWIGYNYVILGLFACMSVKSSEGSLNLAYKFVEKPLKLCQIASCMEIVHSLLGLTKGSIVAPLMQVFGRNFALFVVLSSEERLHNNSLNWYLFFAWSIVEAVRFPYYMFTLLKKEYKWLTWLRYTIWIPLYSMGGVSEALLFLRAISYFEETEKWSISLPNVFNFSFYFPYYLKVHLVGLFIGISFLMKHMMVARKKKLGGGKAKLH
ncbi:DgyrCDS14106 [Dimorphilus gyrociliatus]|uniref:Very-long-chain (3R)-3-hydroxyacyl-CoA dehydratase n=1 Tax=Dimorphilus gyrociliatus TaxID=2664684 RepID=A0A7I8WCM2_9ANNE|nr:DgyrCDS14106 [Dimorphilus gyrociliatus]